MEQRSPPAANRLLHDYRHILYSGVAVAIVVVIAVAMLALLHFRQEAQSQVSVTTQNLAKSVEQTIEGVIDTIDVVLLASSDEISRQIASGHPDKQAITRFLAHQQQQLPHLDLLRATTETGATIYGLGVPSPPASNGDRDYFQLLRDNPHAGLVIAKPIVGKISKSWIWLMARRIDKADGSFAGVVYGSLFIDEIEKMLAKIDMQAGSVIALRDASLALIARKSFQATSPLAIGDTRLSNPFKEALSINADEGSYISDNSNADGVSRSYSYRRNPKYGFTVLVGIPADAGKEEWHRQIAVVSGLALALIVSSLIFALLIGRSWRRQEQYVASLEANENALREAQVIANLGHYYFDLRTDRWTSSDILDDIFGIDAGYLRDSQHWLELVDADFRNEMQAYLQRVIDERLAFDHEYRIVRPRDGQTRWVYGKGSLRLDPLGTPIALQGTIQDITVSKLAEEQIRNLAYFDALTALPNRRLLMDRLGQALIASNRTQEFGALMILDLDNFKALNDTQGHDTGDRLLVEAAQRIEACLRQEDTVSRLGGDEFVVMVEGLGQDETFAATQAEMIAEKIRAALSLPYSVKSNGESYQSTSSIGLTLFRGQGLAIDVLLKQADVALYQAKGAGRNTLRFFNLRMQEAIESRSALEAALRNGLQLQEFQLYYQPQVDQVGRLTGAEALLRWFPGGGEGVSPVRFIPLAEETGLIIPIGLWVLETACAQLRLWAESPVSSEFQIAVNVSARQFRQVEFVDQVRSCLERSGARPCLLKLELTEGVVLENVEEVISRMLQIKALGVSFSLDDFGTGFSSLSYLKRLPLNQVKIDQSFVRDIAIDPNDAAIVRAIIAMSKSLGIDVIAEGVESEAQLHFLHESGCTNYQGYLFGKPMPIGDWKQILS